MPTDLLDQLANLRPAFDALAPPVTIDEVVHHRGQRFGARRLVSIAAAIVLLGGGAVTLTRRGDSDSMHSDVGTEPAEITTTSPTGPSEPTEPSVIGFNVPEGSTLRFTTTLNGDGLLADAVTVYDTPEGQVCVFVHEPSGAVAFGCDDLANVEAGRSFSYMSDRADVPGLVVGLAPLDIHLRVTVGDTEVTPDANGLWYAAVPLGITEFTLTSDLGTEVFTIGPAPLPTP